MVRRSFVGALGAALLLPTVTVAQPQIHPLAPTTKTVEGRIWLSETDGKSHLTVNRSETYELVNTDAWQYEVRHSADQQVEARIEVVEKGMFGGKARVLGLAKDLKGRVVIAMDGGPLNLVANKSQGFEIEDAEWSSYLYRQADQEVEARIRITEPGMFGGKASIDHVYRDVRGWVYAAQDGGPVSISANKSNSFQVRGELAGLLLALENKHVSARLKLTSGGMFGGSGEVLSIDAVTRRSTRLWSLGGGSTPLDKLAKGTVLEVTGKSARYKNYLEVKLQDGTSGVVAKRALELEAPIPMHGAAAAVEASQQ